NGPAGTRELPSVDRAKDPGFANTPRSFPRQMLFFRQLALCKGRIEFTSVWDQSFASVCSPPRIAATQRTLATRRERVSDELRLSLVGFMVSSAHGTRASCRRVSTSHPNPTVNHESHPSGPCLHIRVVRRLRQRAISC